MLNHFPHIGQYRETLAPYYTDILPYLPGALGALVGILLGGLLLGLRPLPTFCKAGVA